MITKAENKILLRDECLSFIKSKRYKRVLDVGGALYPWARDVVSHYLDINDPKEVCGPEFHCSQFLSSTFIEGDICRQETWDRMQKFDPFDFVICSQTLEDIRDPTVALRNLSKIAKQGFITVPVKYRELSFVEIRSVEIQNEWQLKSPYRGYFHHRWIFTIDDGKLYLFPKLNFVEHIQGLENVLDQSDNGCQELAFFWEDSIPFEIVNDDFLGPNPPSVFGYYRDLLEKGL
jgi:hypothetical protein